MIHLVVFSHFQLGVLHISLQPHKIQPRRWKKKNKQTNKHGLGSAPSARKGVCDTLHSPCICRLLQAGILRKISTKATRNVNSSLTILSHSLLLLTVLPLDCYLAPTGLFYPPLSTDCLLWDLPSLLHFRSRRRSHPQSFVWVSRQNRQRDRLSGANTNGNKLLHTVSHCLTESKKREA